MIKDNLIGIIISALLHAGLFSWVYAIKDEPIKLATSNKTVLTVKLFQEKVVTPPLPLTSPIIKTAEKTNVNIAKKRITAVTPISPEFADLAAINITTTPKSIKIAQKKSELISSPKQQPKNNIKKPKVIKRVLVKKNTVTATKKKKKKKIIKPKIFKKRIVRKKLKKKQHHKKRLNKTQIAKRSNKKTITKVQAHPRAIKHAVKRPVKKIITHQKLGGMYSKKTQPQHHQTLGTIPTSKVSKRIAPKQAHNTAKSPTTNTAQNARLSQQYKVRLQRLIASKKRYPKRAKRRGQQGRVTVTFRIRHSGIISDIRIIKGAKNKSLNEATITAIKLASGKLAFPKGMSKKSLKLTITLTYILS